MEIKFKIFEHIQSFPGKTFTEIVNELGISPSTARFHFEKFEKNKIISSVNIDKKRYFIFETPSDEQIQISIQNNLQLKKILQKIQKPKTLTEIAYDTNSSKSMVSKRIKILVRLGFVTKTIDNERIVFCKT